jgi:hypothetical protein
MLFRSQTLVLVVLGLVLIASSSKSNAQTSNNVNSDYDVKGNTELCMKSGGGTYQQCYKQAVEDAKQLKEAGKDGNECKDASKEFDKAAKDFGGKCPGVGLPGNAKKCAAAIANCSSEDSDTDKRACPSKGADWTKYQTEARDMEKDIAKLEKEKSDYQPKMAEINETAQKQLANISSERSKAQAEYAAAQAKAQADSQKQLNEQQKQAMATYMQKQAQYDQLSQQLRMIPIQEAQAQIQNVDQKMAEARMSCYDQAIAQVEKKEQVDLDLIQKGKWTCGNFVNCLRRAGLTDQGGYQMMAAQLEHDCVISDKFRVAADINQKAANNIRMGLEVQRIGLIRQQSQMLQDMNQFQAQVLQDQNTTYQSVYLAAQAAATKFNSQMSDFANREQTNITSTQQRLASVQEQINSVDKNIEAQRSYLHEKQQAMELAKKASHGATYSESKAEKVEEAFNATDAAAKSAVAKCKCREDDADKSCATYKDFLAYEGSGVDVEEIHNGPQPGASVRDAIAADPPPAMPQQQTGLPYWTNPYQPPAGGATRMPSSGSGPGATTEGDSPWGN